MIPLRKVVGEDYKDCNILIASEYSSYRGNATNYVTCQPFF